MSPTPNTPVLPEQFGPYRIERLLGQGGMGAVYLALDTRLSRQVALKVCHVADDPLIQARFRREARAAAGLSHQNLCPVYEFDVRDGIAYITMAFIDGPTLDVWVRDNGPLGPREAAVLVAKLAMAVQVAHEAGVVHRDLKPANVVIGKKGEPVILDFGLARETDAENTRLTSPGAVVGTPSYMAPEQLTGDPGTVGPSADVYALGVILYELLTGHVPFEGPLVAVLTQLLYNAPPSPRAENPAVDAALEAVCLKALAKDPAGRPRNMKELARSLLTVARTLPAAPPTPAPKAPPPAPAPAVPGAGATLHNPTTTVTTSPAPKGSVNSIGMALVYLRPGSFQMGSPTTEDGRDADESPQHRVTLTQGFHMSATLVTQRQWRAVMGADGPPSSFHGDDLPVDSVSWDAAREFCKRLSEKEGREYRLPTEAEWEYAARAGTTTPFWQGQTITTDQANFDGSHPYLKTDARGSYRQKTTPVTYFRPNPWGLYDMGGNLWQWCEDRHGDYPNGPTTDPRGAASGERRVVRGGSWFDHARGCRVANRSGFAPDTADDLVGFRVVVVAAPA